MGQCVGSMGERMVVLTPIIGTVPIYDIVHMPDAVYRNWIYIYLD